MLEIYDSWRVGDDASPGLWARVGLWFFLSSCLRPWLVVGFVADSCLKTGGVAFCRPCLVVFLRVLSMVRVPSSRSS
ncbi:unnamed protein product [Arabis nemorensis]|uniref:Uncharacterized protein n=1 Tax=Arabis nemorensis TaxID=586526 RepID=A0A565CQ74_9BRAS|nr:unnamed protein product [Arabis nemorensis]